MTITKLSHNLIIVTCHLHTSPYYTHTTACIHTSRSRCLRWSYAQLCRPSYTCSWCICTATRGQYHKYPIFDIDACAPCLPKIIIISYYIQRAEVKQTEPSYPQVIITVMITFIHGKSPTYLSFSLNISIITMDTACCTRRAQLEFGSYIACTYLFTYVFEQ